MQAQLADEAQRRVEANLIAAQEAEIAAAERAAAAAAAREAEEAKRQLISNASNAEELRRQLEELQKRTMAGDRRKSRDVSDLEELKRELEARQRENDALRAGMENAPRAPAPDLSSSKGRPRLPLHAVTHRYSRTSLPPRVGFACRCMPLHTVTAGPLFLQG